MTVPLSLDWTVESIKPHLRGSLAFPVTPYDANGDVDLVAVADNARFLATSGISAIVAPSGTGEFFALTPEESMAIVEATVAVAGDKPVIAPAGFGPRIGAQLARHAQEAGAAGIMMVAPYYGKPDPKALIAYYAEIAGATSLPVIPYARDAALFTPAMVEDLVNTIPTCAAFKDGRGDVRLFQQIRERVIGRLGPDRLVWLGGTGDDLVGPYFAAGAEGFTSSLACFWPEASVQLFELASNGNFAGLAEYHAHVVGPIYEFRQRRPGWEVSVMKAAMELLGFRAGPVRPPLANLTPADVEALKALLAPLDIPTAADRMGASVA